MGSAQVNIFSNDRDITKCQKFLHAATPDDATDDDRAVTIPRRHFLKKKKTAELVMNFIISFKSVCMFSLSVYYLECLNIS